LVDETYSRFVDDQVAPLVKLDDGLWVMEQFHGPTLAFKDFALQFLGHIFDVVLAKRKAHITIVGATSGDTGSAAIQGCRGRSNMDIFILYPQGRVSEVQRRQMTSVTDKNVHCIAVEGSFDDCQDAVKAMFNDADFRKTINMSAVNSINWARIMAQIVYYIYASSRFAAGVSFAVPTGNFGNVYAGYLAKKMGAPIDRLIVATNRNDILHRFFQSGEMKIEGVCPSLSPSMDIQVSSNFERLLFDVMECDAGAVREIMDGFKSSGSYSLPKHKVENLKDLFASYKCDDDETRATLRDVFERYDYIADPHTVTGLKAALDFKAKYKGDVMCMATAHPAKFPDAVKLAIGHVAKVPERLEKVMMGAETFDILPADIDQIKSYILEHLEKA